MLRFSMSRGLVPEASKGHRRCIHYSTWNIIFCPPLVGVIVGAPHLLRACVSGSVSFGWDHQIGDRDYFWFARKGFIVRFGATGSLWKSYLTLCTFGSSWLQRFKVIFDLDAGGSGVEHAPGVQEVRRSNPWVNHYFSFDFKIVQ